jgi:flagellar motility protein MotE (MotC chaperone)
MIRIARDFRLIPIVLLATISLFALKVSGLVFDGGYTLAERLQGLDKTDLKTTTADSVPDYPRIVVADRNALPDSSAVKLPWAQEMFNFRDSARGDITGSAGASEKPAEPPLKTSEKPPGPPKLEVAGDAYPLEPGKINSPGERAVLGRLQDRRKELENRSRELDMRENLIKAAEKRLEAKVAELRDIESRIKAASGDRDMSETQRFKSIVDMYENMKPKEAARIFERLDMKILVRVSTAMKPRSMSEILAQMSAEAAERLTVELANRASVQSNNPDQLPKIEGKPSNG